MEKGGIEHQSALSLPAATNQGGRARSGRRHTFARARVFVNVWVESSLYNERGRRRKAVKAMMAGLKSGSSHALEETIRKDRDCTLCVTRRRVTLHLERVSQANVCFNLPANSENGRYLFPHLLLLVNVLQSIMEHNGGSVIAMVGKDCVAIASDLRLGNQALSISSNFQRACAFFLILSS